MQKTRFGTIIQSAGNLHLKDGGQQKLCVIHPLAFLVVALDHCPLYREHLYQLVRLCGGVLSIALYSDGINPGDVLAANTDRKVEGIYWAFSQLDQHILHKEAAWHTVSVVQASRAHLCIGGMCQVFNLVLQLFFGDGETFREGTTWVELHSTISGTNFRTDLSLNKTSCLGRPIVRAIGFYTIQTKKDTNKHKHNKYYNDHVWAELQLVPLAKYNEKRLCLGRTCVRAIGFLFVIPPSIV